MNEIIGKAKITRNNPDNNNKQTNKHNKKAYTRRKIMNTTESLEKIVKSNINGLGELITIERINLDQVTDKKNSVRNTGKHTDTINELYNLIENEEYDETGKFCPPIITTDNDGVKYLVSGNHRYAAHKKANKKDMLVANVSFYSEKTKLTFQLNENDKHFDKYVKNEQNSKDLYKVIAMKVIQKQIPSDKYDLELFLSELSFIKKVKNKTDKKEKLTNALNQVYKYVNQISGTNHDYVHTYETKSLIKELKDTFIKNDNTLDFEIQGFKELEDSDYDNRAFKNVVDKLYSNVENNTIKPLMLIAHVLGGNDYDDVKNIRNFKQQNLIKNKIEEARKICYIDDHLKFKGFKNGIQDLVNIVFPPQLGNELKDNKKIVDWLNQQINTINT